MVALESCMLLNVSFFMIHVVVIDCCCVFNRFYLMTYFILQALQSVILLWQCVDPCKHCSGKCVLWFNPPFRVSKLEILTFLTLSLFIDLFFMISNF